MPRSRGGPTTWENIVCACLACNVKKGGRTPHEAKMKLVRRPAKPKRNPMLTLEIRESQVRELADLAGRGLLGDRGTGLNRTLFLGHCLSNNAEIELCGFVIVALHPCAVDLTLKQCAVPLGHALRDQGQLFVPGDR